MVITEETQVINNQSFPPEANIMSSCTVYNYLAHFYICFVTTALLCRQSCVRKS